jgi:hypothetical protein
MKRCRMWAMRVAVVVVLVPTAVLAKGTFKGTYGTEHFRSNKRVVLCSYGRGDSLFTVGGTQVSRKRVKFATVGGTCPDPTAPGAAFPIVLAAAVGTFSSGPVTSPTTYTGGIVTQDLVVTLTGYRKGKVSGTIAGTFTPSTPGTATPIEANVTFAAKCSIE